MDPATIPEPAQ